jgi:type IV pilus assembly protein PilX
MSIARLNERAAGNYREKQRSFQLAQTTLQYAEWWLLQGNGTNPESCTTLVDANAAPSSVVSCSTIYSNTVFSSIPWRTSASVDFGFQYTPPNVTISSAGGTNSYSLAPRFYIHSMGTDASNQFLLYRVTAMARAGNDTSNSVLQSIFAVGSNVIDAGAP